MRFLAAIIYCKNDKRGGFTGQWKTIAGSGNIFDTESFLKANSLAGPDSKVHCHLQKDGPYGHTVKVDWGKEAPICQIPGYSYDWSFVNNLKKPEQWSDNLLD